MRRVLERLARMEIVKVVSNAIRVEASLWGRVQVSLQRIHRTAARA